MMRALMAADFSADVATQGESVTTRVATATTAQDFTSTSADQDATTTAKTITLSNYKGTRIGFTDSEWSKSSINLNDVFIQPAVNGIANAIIDSALALVTNQARTYESRDPAHYPVPLCFCKTSSYSRAYRERANSRSKLATIRSRARRPSSDFSRGGRAAIPNTARAMAT
mgnify:CR=1 FL=1